MTRSTDGTTQLLRLRELLDDMDGERSSIVAALFDRELGVDSRSVDARLGRDALDDLAALDLVRRDGSTVRATARFDRLGRLHLASDPRRARREREFVVGPGPATRVVARFARPAAGPLLDLGSGSGALGLLVGRGAPTVAIDINPRAVAFTRFNGALNGVRIDAREGDFLGAPDPGWAGQFETVVANPPFVLTPRQELTYRDRPLPGDRVSERTLEVVAGSLAPGGRGYLLCNWIQTDAADWREPARSWAAGLDVDAVAIRLAEQDPTAYALQWARDLPAAERDAVVRAWADSLAAEGIRSVATGVIAISRSARGALRRPTFTGLDPHRSQVEPVAVEAALAA